MKKAILWTCFTLLLLPYPAFAKPLVSVGITAEKQVSVKENGKKIVKKVPAKTIEAGDVIFYTVSYVNSGNEPATNAVLNDPIPQGSSFIPGTAYGEGAEILFSIDGGKSYKKPSLLSYEITLPNGKTEKRVASPEEYTDIRWIIGKIDAGAKGKVGFQVRIKK